MGKMADADLTGCVRDNIFYDTYAEVVAFYKDQNLEAWEEKGVISLRNTDKNTGLFDKSDIIIVYDQETFHPTIVTERLYKKNYKRGEFRRIERYLKLKAKTINYELGFSVKVTFSRDYIEFIHYKEEWWEWVQKQSTK